MTNQAPNTQETEKQDEAARIRAEMMEARAADNLGLANELARQLRVLEGNYDEWKRAKLRKARIAKRKIEEEKAKERKAEEQRMIEAGYVQVTTAEYEKEWDGEGGEMITRTEWMKKDNEENNIYQKAGADAYTIERLTVVNGIVTEAQLHALFTEIEGNDSLPHYIGLTVAEIEALGFTTGYDPDIIRMCNQYQTGSTYHGLGVGHGNANVPAQVIKVDTGRKV